MNDPMSATEAKDFEEQPPLPTEPEEHERKHPYLINEASQEEDEETIPRVTDTSKPSRSPDTRGDSHSHHEKSSKTIDNWLTKDTLMVYPVWIGNLPRQTRVPDLRRFLQDQLGRVLISVHISFKRKANERTYAFLNLPTAEKQILAVTLLDGTVFRGEKLIVRSKRPSKFPPSFFGRSPISDHFRHFRDSVVPAILIAPSVNLNVEAVKRILDEHGISLNHLPNRVWCLQCTLMPNCHRTYCSFYHNEEEMELGKIISILSAQNHSQSDGSLNVDENEEPKRSDRVSRHTLLIEGLPKSVTIQRLTEMFEVFGEIDHVIVNPNNTCFLRMQHSQDARKIVHLLKINNSGIQIQLAPYSANPKLITFLRDVGKKNKRRPPRSQSDGLKLDDQVHSYSGGSDLNAGGVPKLRRPASADYVDRGNSVYGSVDLAMRESYSGPPISGDVHNGMPFAPQPPTPIFKDDDMRYMGGYTPSSAAPPATPPSPAYGYMGSQQMMASDWNSTRSHNYYTQPPHGYQYRNPGLPQFHYMSASDPFPYQPTHGYSTTPVYQTHHHGHEHEQSSRHRRRPLDPYSSSWHDHSVQPMHQPGPSAIPSTSFQTNPPIHDILDDIPGI